MKRFLVTVLTSQLAVLSTCRRHVAGSNGKTLHPLARPGYVGAASSRRRRQADITTSPTNLPRGGDAASTTATTEQSLDDRVEAAMRRLGLSDEEETSPSSDGTDGPAEGVTCEDGVCTVDEQASQDSTPTRDDSKATAASTQEEMFETADRLSGEMNVPKDIALAAVYSSFATDSEGNRQINVAGARDIVQAEVDAIAGVSEDSEPCKQLVSEGYEPFLARRALAFSENNVDNARAILIADQEDQEAEEAEAAAAQAEIEAQQKEEEAAPMKTVTVDYPQNLTPSPEPKKPDEAPPKARREDVIFEGTTETIQELVIESPVPVLLDVYADWCGPCKQLTPALENIAINAGGMLRLVKINTDEQRQISGALEVKALPTIFGIRDGKILNSWQGMPRDENAVRNFLMGLMVPGQKFNPPVSAEDDARYNDLSGKLLKLAAASSFSFSARERLQNRIGKLLNELVSSIGDEDKGMAIADDSARILRSLMNNVIHNPFDVKFRKVNLGNKVIAAKIARHAACLSILNSIGFKPDGDESALVVAKDKRVVNIAPFVVGRDCIDKWIDRNRYLIAKAARKRKDEDNLARLAAEAEEAAKNQPEVVEESEEEEEDDSLCTIKFRLEGEKKLHEIEPDNRDTLSSLLDMLPFEVDEGETVQFTCAARRLVVKSTDADKMAQSLSDLKLAPSASIVVKVGEGSAQTSSKGSMAERAAARKKKTSGSHSMHSIGLYSQNDGSKAETFESGGVLYDHDVSDDEAEEEESSGESPVDESANEGEDRD